MITLQAKASLAHTIQKAVVASEDDASESGNGYFYLDAIHLYVWGIGSEDTYIASGCLFTVHVPKNATIVSAILSLYVSGGNLNLRTYVYGNAVGDAKDFSEEADVIGRTRTDAKITWNENFSGVGWASKKVVSVIQEIVNHDDWSSGNNLVLLLIPSINTGYKCDFYSYDFSSGSRAPQLEISYLTGVGQARADFSSGRAKADFSRGQAKAITLFGIADPDIVDEDVVLALSGNKSGKAKAYFKTGRAKGYLS